MEAKRKRKPKLIAKIAVWMLLVCFAFVFFCGVAGVLVLIDTGAYWDGGRNFREAVAEQVFSFDRVRIRYILSEYLGDNAVDDATYREMYAPENSNVFFEIKDSQGNLLVDYIADEEYQIQYEYKEYIKSAKYEVSENKEFATVEEARRYVSLLEEECYVSLWNYNEDTMELEVFYYSYDDITYTVNAFIRKDFSSKDRYYYSLRAVDLIVVMRYWLILICAVSALACLLSLIFLCFSAGYGDGTGELKLSFIHKIPLDIYLIFCGLCGFFLLSVFAEASRGDEYEWFTVVLFVLTFTVCSVLGSSAIVTFAARVKNRFWWRNTVIYRVLLLLKKVFLWFFGGVKYIFKNIPLFWKAIAVFAVLKILEFIFLLGGRRVFAVFWLLESTVILFAIIHIVISLRKLQKAAQEIAGGDLDYRADLSYMPHTLKEHGENLNNISQGLKTALGEQIKSEHMKAELITNVSHDIKTPLTSIVNYVGLLKKEGLDSTSAQEYLEVLERQAGKLKKLTEDLIEASKATSGCITVNAEKTDINVLLAQASGEYEGKFHENDLIPVLSLSEENPTIFADGGLVWRVFDNLLNNICKYSQKGTRVYLKSEVHEDKVFIMFSNISAAQLDISSDELMERFVRGDSSRNTEGSGLGLSIAQSLIELQGGTFDIKIDGDLFKAEIVFDVMR